MKWDVVSSGSSLRPVPKLEVVSFFLLFSSYSIWFTGSILIFKKEAQKKGGPPGIQLIPRDERIGVPIWIHLISRSISIVNNK